MSGRALQAETDRATPGRRRARRRQPASRSDAPVQLAVGQLLASQVTSRGLGACRGLRLEPGMAATGRRGVRRRRRPAPAHELMALRRRRAAAARATGRSGLGHRPPAGARNARPGGRWSRRRTDRWRTRPAGQLAVALLQAEREVELRRSARSPATGRRRRSRPPGPADRRVLQDEHHLEQGRAAQARAPAASSSTSFSNGTSWCA